MGDVITICNNKGGVGKTFIVWASALNLAESGKKVCCIDTDPQGSLSNTLSQTWRKDKNGTWELVERLEFHGTSAKQLFNADTELDGLNPLKDCHGIDLFFTEPNDFSAIPIFNPPEGKAQQSAERFARILNVLRPLYDYIFIDVPPFGGQQVIASMFVADYLLVPLQVESHAIKGTEGEITLFQRLGALDKLLGVVLNHVHRESSHHRRCEERLRADLGDVIFRTTIHDSVTIDTATAVNTSLRSIAGGYKARREIEKVIEEMLERIAMKKGEH